MSKEPEGALKNTLDAALHNVKQGFGHTGLSDLHCALLALVHLRGAMSERNAARNYNLALHRRIEELENILQGDLT